MTERLQRGRAVKAFTQAATKCSPMTKCLQFNSMQTNKLIMFGNRASAGQGNGNSDNRIVAAVSYGDMAITANCRSSLVFIDRGVIIKQIHQQKVLNEALISWPWPWPSAECDHCGHDSNSRSPGLDISTGVESAPY